MEKHPYHYRIPRRVCRTQVVGRCLMDMSHVGDVAGGFMVKPNRRVDYADRVMPSFVMVCVLRGRGWFTDGTGTRHEVGPGCVLQMPPGRKHTVVIDPNGAWVEFYLTLPGALWTLMERMSSAWNAEPVLRVELDAALVDHFEQYLASLRDTDDDGLPAVMLDGARLMTRLHQRHRDGQCQDSRRRMIAASCRALGEQLDRRIKLPVLARRFGLSYERFRKVFTEAVGAPPGEYRTRRRLDQARALLNDRRRTLQDVAQQLGYADAFAFSKQFKRYVGVSPSGYRGAAAARKSRDDG
jgi:AraC-like DNA-binding protein